MNKHDGIFAFLYISIMLILLVGYVKNIIRFAECDFEAPYKAEVVYGVGIITGTGCITGYMNLGK